MFISVITNQLTEVQLSPLLSALRIYIAQLPVNVSYVYT